MYKSVHFPQEMTQSVTAFIPFHILNNLPYHPFILILHNVILFIPRVTRNCKWDFQSMTHQNIAWDANRSPSSKFFHEGNIKSIGRQKHCVYHWISANSERGKKRWSKLPGFVLLGMNFRICISDYRKISCEAQI